MHIVHTLFYLLRSYNFLLCDSIYNNKFYFPMKLAKLGERY